MPTGRRRLASPLRTAEPSSPNEAKALSNNPADNTTDMADEFSIRRPHRNPARRPDLSRWAPPQTPGAKTLSCQAARYRRQSLVTSGTGLLSRTSSTSSAGSNHPRLGVDCCSPAF